MATNAVIFHHPDSVDTSRPQLMGRHAAGEGFLKGFVRHSGVEAFHAQTLSDDHFNDFAARVSALDPARRPCRRVAVGDWRGLAEIGTLAVPGPTLGAYAWRRLAGGARAYSLAGVNHTIASEAVMDGLGELLTSPVEPWDAVVCTSRAAKAAIVRLLDGWAEFLARRTGGRARPAPRFPVIPLGVDCDAFGDGGDRAAERARLRRGLGVGERDVAVLFFGRLSFHAKAHPLAMYLALEEAARRTRARIHLVQAGWFANKAIEKEFKDAARAFCPSVKTIYLDGRDPGVRFHIWAAADVFTSLSDNIQETFGLTPVEAMAAGLPVVVSDWNGYRDTVRDGIDGFAVPTWMAAGGSGADLAIPPESAILPEGRDHTYNVYCGTVSQCTAVDVARAAEAFTALVGDPDLRRRMGAEGRKRALELYDWRVVIAKYQELWRELRELREKAAPAAPSAGGQAGNPLRDDPFRLFASYATWAVDDDCLVSIAPGADADRMRHLRRFGMNDFAARVLLEERELASLIERVARQGPLSVLALSASFAPARRDLVPRSVAWLAKMNLVRLTAPVRPRPEPPVEAPAEQAAAPAAEPDAASGTAPAADEAVASADLAPRPAGRPADAEAAAALDAPSAAAALAESVRDRRPGEARSAAGLEPLKRRAREARERGDVDGAAAELRQALAEAPDDPEVNNEVGEMLALTGRLDVAIDCFRNALRNRPAFVAAHRNLGKALFLGGHEAEGVHSFRRAVQLAPDEAESRYLLGAALRRAGAVNEAVQCLKIAIELEGARADPHYELGLALKALGRREEAAQAFDRSRRLDPANGYVLGAEASLKAEAAGRARLAQGKGAKRVALHMGRRFHYPILRPLFDALGRSHWPLLSADDGDVAAFEPHVVVSCDGGAQRLRTGIGRAVFVAVGQGVVSKKRALPAALAADYACALGDGDRERLIRGGVAPDRIWVTGYVQMDPLFRKQVMLPPSALPAAAKTVLFAPTYNPLLSAAPMLGERLVELIRGGRDEVAIVIKPHPLTCEHQAHWMAAWRRLAESRPRVHLVGDPGADVVPYLQAADALVSDCSSAAFMFLALDRPLVLVTNPRHAEDAVHYDEEGVEWSHRAAGEEVADVGSLAAAVERALADPAAGREGRRRALDHLFGGLTDGRAVERVVERLSALAV